MAAISSSSPGSNLVTENQSAETPLQVDEGQNEDLDSSYDVSVELSSQISSINSSILNYRYENGRRYHAFRDGTYLVPNDEEEQNRMDLLHHIYSLLLDGKLFLAPIGDQIGRVLDLGTGTGIWAIDFADENPSAEVLGTDLSPIQPDWTPPNCIFEVDDFEAEWLYRTPFDFIHARELQGCIRNDGRFFKQALKHLAPGGYLEIQAAASPFLSDDGTAEKAVNAQLWLSTLCEGAAQFGTPLDSAPTWKAKMEAAGFESVHEEVRKLPIGTWPKDPKLKEIGKFQAIQAVQAIESYTPQIFSNVLGWSQEEIQVSMAKARNEIKDPAVHLYFPYGFLSGPHQRASLADEMTAGLQVEMSKVQYEQPYAKYDVYITVKRTGFRSVDVNVIVWKTTKQCFLDLETVGLIPPIHAPKSAAEAANRWLKVCESQHSACRKRSLPPKDASMPTRLLDLGGTDSTTWCLCKPETRASYIALSHRWSEHTPTLNQTNLHACCSPQTDSILPKSYQDIIATCRAIPIRYLWIDSLCIIQDDGGTEFRHEAPLMTDIYANAFLTLTICWNIEDRSVFRECRPRSIPRPGRVAAYEHANWESINHKISLTDEFVLVQELDPNDFQTCVNYAPINCRAWVVQERCLSRRILYLGNDQLYWECDECVGNEASPHGIYHFQKRESIRNLTGEERDGPWSWTLEKYVTCDLTYEQDRLIAIAGLAKAISANTGDTFFAGIWLETWMQDLLWTPKSALKAFMVDWDPGIHTLHKKTSLATPSWSWLDHPGSVVSGAVNAGRGPRISIATPQTYESNEYRPLAMLRQTNTVPEGASPYASFDKAILKIRGLLIPIMLDGIQDMDNPSEKYLLYDNTGLHTREVNCLILRPYDGWDDITFSIHFSRPVDVSARLFLLSLYVSEMGPGEREFTRVGFWLEDFRFASYIIPMVVNTIVTRGIGTDHVLSGQPVSEQDRIFDSRLRSYALNLSSTQVRFPIKDRSIQPKTESEDSGTEDESDSESDNQYDSRTDNESNNSGTDDKSESSSDSDSEIINGTSMFGAHGIGTMMVQCSLLPYFSTAEWTTISLV
ncbi:hypothetical protein FGRMN_1722 [Fusarium graminum]|nr:hypothetical protein FGRMN_1722 [Fusarium graminum]